MSRISNAHFPGAPARMSDGRIFTDYRPNCDLNPPSWGDYETRQNIIQGGTSLIAGDRAIATQRAGESNCVDTMVPESQKRVCRWDGCSTVPAHAAGLGMGRIYVPERADMASADPDELAITTFPAMFGTFSQVSNAVSNQPVPARAGNRYSAPYGRS